MIVARRSTNAIRVARTRLNATNVIPPQSKVPPGPPKEKAASGGGNGTMVLVGLAILGGTGYYFQDEIKSFLNPKPEEKKPAVAAPKPPAPAKVESAPVKAAAPIATVKETTAPVKPAEPKPAPVESKVTKKEVEELAKKVETVASPAAGTSKDEPVDYDMVRKAIADILDIEGYDDGSNGPLFVRLAWHAAGTYDAKTKQGGSDGSKMRFENESKWGANAGLDIARARLEPIKAKFPGISYADLWSLAGTVAIEEMGGPTFKWRPGRKDVTSIVAQLPDGLLPDADGRDKRANPADHLRDIFGRMGFNDREIVALSGAHALGRCHTDRSGFWGPWTNAPTTFSNEYFKLLLTEKWSPKKLHMGKEWKGPAQFEDKTGNLMMLPTDMALVQDPKMKPIVEEYAKDEKKFFDDFAKAWIKLQELGVMEFRPRRYWIFGPRE